MYIYIYLYIWIYMYIYTYTDIHVYINVYIIMNIYTFQISNADLSLCSGIWPRFALLRTTILQSRWSLLLPYAPVLQCVAVCCRVLQCVAVCCSVLQCIAVAHHHCVISNIASKTMCSYVAVCFSVLQCVAMHHSARLMIACTILCSCVSVSWVAVCCGV